MTAILFVGVWLTSYRLWKLVAKDVILERPRKAFFKRFPPDPPTAQLVGAPGVHKLGVFVACPWCSGYWLSGFVVLAVSYWSSMEMPVLWWFATSAAVGLTAKQFD